MNNPIFDFIDESFPSHVHENMGFNTIVIQGASWPSDESDKYAENPEEWMENWEIEVPDGYTLISKHDTEDGPFALMVKPTTRYAQALLEFGDSREIQEAVKLDNIDRAKWQRQRVEKMRARRNSR